MMVHIALSLHADNLSGIAATQERQRHRNRCVEDGKMRMHHDDAIDSRGEAYTRCWA